MQFSQKRKIFPQFIFDFVNLDLISNIFKKTMTLIADVFVNLWTPKDVVR